MFRKVYLLSLMFRKDYSLMFRKDYPMDTRKGYPMDTRKGYPQGLTLSLFTVRNNFSL